jgi:hypothetical protein
MPDGDHRLAVTATGQHGAFTRDQAVQSGISSARLRGRVQSGLLVRVGSRTFRNPLHRPGLIGDLWAQIIDIGGPCWAAGPTAAALHGFDGHPLALPFHVLLPRGRSVHRVGVLVHTTVELPLIDRATVEGLPVTSATRTIIDLARIESPKQLTVAIDSALRDRLTSEMHLHERLAALRGRGRYGLPTLFDAIEGSEASRGGHSWLERRFLELLAGAGLPRPSTQQTLSKRSGRLVRVDLHFEGTPLVVELMGYRHHRTRDQLRIDAERMNALVSGGFAPLQFSYDQVVDAPDECVRTVASMLARHVPDR